MPGRRTLRVLRIVVAVAPLVRGLPKIDCDGCEWDNCELDTLYVELDTEGKVHQKYRYIYLERPRPLREHDDAQYIVARYGMGKKLIFENGREVSEPKVDATFFLNSDKEHREYRNSLFRCDEEGRRLHVAMFEEYYGDAEAIALDVAYLKKHEGTYDSVSEEFQKRVENVDPWKNESGFSEFVQRGEKLKEVYSCVLQYLI